MATVLPVRNETSHTTMRMTKEGRKISYRLTVIQQPERARACGSGAKSSADRRPVDPPPIVELRIFEGDALNDITFSYNANFFLFATLEPARPIAQGRVPQTQSAFPVLTGMFVSGIAYLDRPNPAGYFLFPDLSVRHEGCYRLSFNLYEDTKDAKDADAEPRPQHPSRNLSRMQTPNGPKVFVDWRLEVKSQPFTVYSAKKFPGLAESTVLSRIVAEQGCRVRIRRDVRMRRRDHKGGPIDMDEYDDDLDHAGTRPTPTPDPYQHPGAPGAPPHPVEAAVPPAAAADPPPPPPPAAAYELEPPRRASIHEAPPPSRQPAPPPPPPQYARQSYPPPYGASPGPSQPGPDGYPALAYGPPMHGPYPPHPHAYGPPPPPPAAPSAAAAPPTGTYGPVPPANAAPQGPPMMSSHQHAHRDSLDRSVPSRRGSVSYHQPQSSVPPAGPPPYPYPEKGYARAQPAFQPYMGPQAAPYVPRTPTPGGNGHPLPPLKMPMPMEPKYDAATSSAGATSGPRSAAPLPSPGVDANPYKVDVYSPYAAPPPTAPETTRVAKRPYGTVFNAAPYDRSLRHGMRPPEPDGSEPVRPLDADGDDDDDCGGNLARMRMQYKRADGTEISRRAPSST